VNSPAHPPVPWPGLSPAGTLLVPLHPDWLAAPFGNVFEMDGLGLVRKSEFHVTVLNRAMAATALPAFGEARIRDLYGALSWAPRRTGRYALLHESKDAQPHPIECWSLIEHLDLPAMLHFRTELASALGPVFADPVPHVTHFVLGDPNGIGLPDGAALEARLVREIRLP
jgi:hypothetical protein